jgi:hypothetical protein
LNPVQDGLNLKLNSWSPGSGFAVFDQPQTTRTVGDQLFVSGRVDGSASGDALKTEARFFTIGSVTVPDGRAALDERNVFSSNPS